MRGLPQPPPFERASQIGGGEKRADHGRPRPDLDSTFFGRRTDVPTHHSPRNCTHRATPHTPSAEQRLREARSDIGEAAPARGIGGGRGRPITALRRPTGARMATPVSEVANAAARRGHGKWNGFRWWAREGRQAQPLQPPQGDGGAARAEDPGQPHAARGGDAGHLNGHLGGGGGGGVDSRCVARSPGLELGSAFSNE